MQLPTRFVGLALAWLPVRASIGGDNSLPQQIDNRLLAPQLPTPNAASFLGARPVQELQPSLPVLYPALNTPVGYVLGTGTEPQASVFLTAPPELAPQLNSQLLQVPNHKEERVLADRTNEVEVNIHVNPASNGVGSGAGLSSQVIPQSDPKSYKLLKQGAINEPSRNLTTSENKVGPERTSVPKQATADLTAPPPPALDVSREKQSAGKGPPAAGNLIAKARTRLRASHMELSNVSQELLQVQDAVDGAERSMFGRILDVDQARTFASDHQQVLLDNYKAEDLIVHLKTQVSQLSAKLAVAQRAYVARLKEERQDEGGQRRSLVEESVVIQQLEAERNRSSQWSQNHTTLMKDRERLTNQSTRLKRVGEEAIKTIPRMRTAARAEKEKQERLRKSVLEMHLYCIECHTHVQEMAKTLKIAKAMVPKESTAASAAQGQADEFYKAEFQNMMAEGALVRAEIQKKEKDVVQAIKTLRKAKWDLMVLEGDIKNETGSIDGRINATKMRGRELARSLSTNTGVQTSDLETKRGLQLQLKDLQKRLSPVVYDALRAENDAYTVEVKQAMALVQDSKVDEARGAAQAQQAKAAEAAFQKAAKVAEDALRDAEEEGQKKLQEAVAAAAANRKEQEKRRSAALEVINKKCKVEWKQRAAENDKKIEQCKKMEQELLMVQAQKQTLEQTLKAQQTANAATQ